MEKTFSSELKSMISNSVTLKLIVIIFLTLFLLIPQSMIKSIIREREQLHATATHDVSSKWANTQQIDGPILSIPFMYEVEKNDEVSEMTKLWHVLPEQLDIKGNIEPKTANSIRTLPFPPYSSQKHKIDFHPQKAF